MTSLEKITKYFQGFPGIGPRQARRFAHHLLIETPENIKEFSELIANIQSSVAECTSCFRFFAKNGGGTECRICADHERDRTKLMVVERDTDMESIERGGVYDGLYFILGGTVPLLESEDAKKLRGGALKRITEERAEKGLDELILAFSVNPDGENTGRFVESILKEILEKYKIKVSYLGRGLSTGSELEYADPETIKNALKNRI